MQWSNEQRKKTALVVACLLFLGVACWFAMDRFDLLGSPPVPASARPVKSSIPGAPPHAKDPASQPETPSVSTGGSPAVPFLVTAGTLGNLTAKQAALDEVSLDVKFAEQQAKLKKLNEPPMPTTPTAPVMQGLPDLPVMPVQPVTSLPTLPIAEKPRSGVYVLSIQGFKGPLSAVVATAQGRKTVRVGDHLAGKVVESITMEAVTLRSGSTRTQLPFED